jgi:hypothetical protein
MGTVLCVMPTSYFYTENGGDKSLRNVGGLLPNKWWYNTEDRTLQGQVFVNIFAVIDTVACTVVPIQRPRHGRIFQGRFWATVR